MKNLIKHSLITGLMTVISACSSVPYHAPSPQVDERSTQPDMSVPTRTNTTTGAIEPATTAAVPLPSTSPVVTIEQSQPVRPVAQNPAVIALLNSASEQQLTGDYHSAQNTLQRAQRIAPRDPQIYYELANTHLQLESYALAEQVALKGVSLVQGQPSQLKRFWTLIAQIRLQSGNAKGAEQARATAAKY